MLDEVRNVVELTSIWAERTRGTVHGGTICPDPTNPSVGCIVLASFPGLVEKAQEQGYAYG